MDAENILKRCEHPLTKETCLERNSKLKGVMCSLANEHSLHAASALKTERSGENYRSKKLMIYLTVVIEK